MADALEEREQAKRETGASLMFIGFALWLVDLAVLFFRPSDMRLGRETMFFTLIFALAVLGLLLMVGGYLMRGKPEE